MISGMYTPYSFNKWSVPLSRDFFVLTGCICLLLVMKIRKCRVHLNWPDQHPFQISKKLLTLLIMQGNWGHPVVEEIGFNQIQLLSMSHFLNYLAGFEKS